MAKSSNVVYANTDQMDCIADLLKGFPKSAVGVLNRVLVRTANTVRVETARQIPKVFGAPQKEIKSALSSSKRKIRTIVGNSGTGSVSVEVVGRPLTATRFRHTPKELPAERAKRRAAEGKKVGKPRKYKSKVMIYRTRGMKFLGPVKGQDGKKKSVFLAPTGAKNSSGVQHIFFYRTGVKNSKGREKIKAVTTLSVPQMVVNEKVATPLLARINEVLEKRTEHELNREFGSLGSNLKKAGWK